jgi:uncharacterized protein YndB with AHSA1/START domain
MKKEIKYEWNFEQTPAEVWEYLTQPELLALWLMPNNFLPALGHEFTLQTRPMPDLKLDGIFHCKVLKIEPVTELVYSWKGGPGNGIVLLDTICEWRLEPYANGCILKLRHSGFEEHNAAIFAGMNEGWLKKIEKMLSMIATHKMI